VLANGKWKNALVDIPHRLPLYFGSQTEFGTHSDHSDKSLVVMEDAFFLQ